MCCNILSNCERLTKNLKNHNFFYVTQTIVRNFSISLIIFFILPKSLNEFKNPAPI